MNARLFAAVIVLAHLGIGASAQSPVPELGAIKDPYTRNLAVIQKTREQRAAPIKSAYVASLDRLQAQVAADLFASAAVKAERERMAANKEPLEMDKKEMPPALAELRGRYEKDLERANAPLAAQEQQMARQYIAALDTLQRRLTSQNEVAKAAAVRAERNAAVSALPKDLQPKEETSTAAESTVRASAARAAGTLDPALAEKIASAVSSKGFSRSENSGQPGETKGWEDLPEGGGLLIGFEAYEVGKENRLRSLRPYFLTKQGIVAGKDRGKMEKVTDKILARPGYAVAGLITSEGKHGMQVIFMKVDSAAGRFVTDASSTYKSVWLGDKGRDKPKQIGGDGRLVVGVYGKTGADCDDIGLVQLN